MAKRFSGWLGCRLAKRWAAFGIMAFGKIEQRMQHWQAKVDSHPLAKRQPSQPENLFAMRLTSWKQADVCRASMIFES